MLLAGGSQKPQERLFARMSLQGTLFQHDGAAAFQLSERSPLPAPLSAKTLPGGQPQRLNVRQIRGINRPPVENDYDRAPETI